MTRLPLKLAALAGLVVCFAGAGYAPPASAATRVALGIEVGTPPPYARFERMPPGRHGYVWASGYWRRDVRARRYVWVSGYWVRARPGRHYRPAAWVHGRHGRDFRPGNWRR